MKKNTMTKKIRGFTLVEILVSLAIFIIVTAIVGGIYTMLVQKQRDQLGMQNVQQDIQNFFDTLEREVRTGYGEEFSLVSGDVHFLNITNQNGLAVWYNVYKPLPGGGISSDVYQIWRWQGGDVKPITSGRTYIESLRFIIPSKSSSTGSPSYLVGPSTRVTVLVKACVDKPGNSCILAQTSLAVRQLTPRLP